MELSFVDEGAGVDAEVYYFGKSLDSECVSNITWAMVFEVRPYGIKSMTPKITACKGYFCLELISDLDSETIDVEDKEVCWEYKDGKLTIEADGCEVLFSTTKVNVKFTATENGDWFNSIRPKNVSLFVNSSHAEIQIDF